MSGATCRCREVAGDASGCRVHHPDGVQPYATMKALDTALKEAGTYALRGAIRLRVIATARLAFAAASVRGASPTKEEHDAG